MYNYIKGTITFIKGDYIVIENNGIGYQIKTPNSFNYEVNENTTIFTYLHVREDIHELYGFSSQLEKDLFLKLISVKGLGPKTALAILATGAINKVTDAIQSGDSKYLQKFPGIGAKASQQIVLDLRGKIDFSNNSTKPFDPKVQAIKDGLKTLGYGATEIKNVTPIIEANIDKTNSELMKIVLQKLL